MRWQTRGRQYTSTSSNSTGSFWRRIQDVALIWISLMVARPVSLARSLLQMVDRRLSQLETSSIASYVGLDARPEILPHGSRILDMSVMVGLSADARNAREDLVKAGDSVRLVATMPDEVCRGHDVGDGNVTYHFGGPCGDT